MKKWYAVMQDNDIYPDWGTGSHDLAQALAMAQALPGGYVAVIDDGPDPVCIDVIRP